MELVRARELKCEARDWAFILHSQFDVRKVTLSTYITPLSKWIKSDIWYF
jgi:energy-converting hydrogenase Eha subunit F